jgi:hypothetical protein
VIGSAAADVGEFAISLVIAVAWIQLGRKQRSSLFVAAGAIGWVAPAFVLVLNLEIGTSSFGLFEGLGLAEVITSLVYFAVQLLAFNSAANSFQVRPFKYAVYLLATQFVVSLVGGSAGAALVEMQHASLTGLPNVLYGIGLAFSATTSLAAGIGFHRVREMSFLQD